MSHFDLGDLMRVTATFTDESDDPVDPTTVRFYVLHDDEEAEVFVYNTDVEVVREGVGVYHLDVSLTEAGYWRVRAAATGDGQAAEELAVTVYSSFT